MSYVSQEAAYEVAVSEAAGDLRTGHEIRIEVLGPAYERLWRRLADTYGRWTDASQKGGADRSSGLQRTA